MTGAAAAAAVLLSAIIAGQTTAAVDAVAECKRLQSEFAVDAMEPVCRSVADDPSQDIASRIFALRLLAGAQLLKGDERAAEMVLIRMLTFDVDAAPAADDGPDFRRLLMKARKRVIEEGAFELTLVREPDKSVRTVQLRDPLGRVARVEHHSAEQTTALARFDEKPGLATFAFERNVSAGDVVLVGWTNKELRRVPLAEPVPAPAPASAPAASSAASAPSTTHPAVSWTLIATGSVLVTVGALVAGVTYVDANTREPCDVDPQGCVPNRPLLFGLYAAENRADFFNDAEAWLAGGVFTMFVGAVTAGAGVVLLAPSE